MAGSLVKIAETTVTSSQASVTLTGINSTYDVYMLKMNNITIDTDNKTIFLRVTTSGAADSDSEYDRAHYVFRTSTSFAEVNSINQTSWAYNTVGTAAGEIGNAIMYLFNFNNSSEYSFYTLESAEITSSAELQGIAGGGVHTVAEANDGIHIFVEDSANIDAGVFTLFGFKK
jgi:hypothetical protein|tara:strand:+ start:1858 stop:2376 length:519 start_codon:yes stop_codon:yes gene_type:complete